MMEVHGTPQRIDPATEGAPLRGVLALLMRSIASPQDAHNYCALTKEEAGRCVPLTLELSSKFPSRVMAHHPCWGTLGLPVRKDWRRSRVCDVGERQGDWVSCWARLSYQALRLL